MKHFVSAIAISVLFPLLLAAAPSDLSSETRDMLEKLSLSYMENRVLAFRSNIAVGDILTTGEDREMMEIAEAIRDLVMMQLEESTIFHVLDRHELDSVMTEQKRQLSGITREDDTVEIGNLLNAHAILQGSLNQTESAIQLTLKLTDVETGETFTRMASVSRTQLEATRETVLDMSFVQKMGIGLSLISGGTNALGNNPSYSPFFNIGQTALVRIYGGEVKYRFSKNFMIGAGAASVYCQLKHFDYLAHDPSANPNSSADFYGDEFNISGTGTSTFLNLYGVINPVRRLNLFVSLGPEWLVIPFDGRFEPSNGNGFGVNEYGPSVYAETVLWNFSAGAEYFFTPRLAFSLKMGYSAGEFTLTTGPGNGHLDLPETTVVSLNSIYYQPSFSVYF